MKNKIKKYNIDFVYLLDCYDGFDEKTMKNRKTGTRTKSRKLMNKEIKNIGYTVNKLEYLQSYKNWNLISYAKKIYNNKDKLNTKIDIDLNKLSIQIN